MKNTTEQKQRYQTVCPETEDMFKRRDKKLEKMMENDQNLKKYQSIEAVFVYSGQDKN